MVAQARHSRGKTAIQLHISLKEHTPTIWRRLVVPGEVKLSKLHSMLQVAMGWEDYHLHLFRIGDISYGVADEFEDDEFDDIDEDSVLFSDVVQVPMQFSYQYDFGDNWQHEVIIETIESVPLVLKFAACIDGQRACPPEDCGGTGGFEDFLGAVTDPTHKDHVNYVQWVGGPFDPEAFSVAATNAALQRVR
jgi:Plasmid pRiA4b ORF-3-like protein